MATNLASELARVLVSIEVEIKTFKDEITFNNSKITDLQGQIRQAEARTQTASKSAGGAEQNKAGVSATEHREALLKRLKNVERYVSWDQRELKDMLWAKKRTEYELAFECGPWC